MRISAKQMRKLGIRALLALLVVLGIESCGSSNSQNGRYPQEEGQGHRHGGKGRGRQSEGRQEHKEQKLNPRVSLDLIQVEQKDLDDLPSYPGGDSYFRSYINRNCEYPESAIKQRVEGKVVIKYTVGVDGYICNEKIVEGIGFGCDEIALNAVKDMPKWTPGKKGGSAVQADIMIAIEFAIVGKEGQ